MLHRKYRLKTVTCKNAEGKLSKNNFYRRIALYFGQLFHMLKLILMSFFRINYSSEVFFDVTELNTVKTRH